MEAHVQDDEGFAVIWRNAQRARRELLGVWCSRLVSRLWKFSNAGWQAAEKYNPNNVVSGFGVVYELGVCRRCLFGQPAVIQAVAPINLGSLMRS